MTLVNDQRPRSRSRCAQVILIHVNPFESVYNLLSVSQKYTKVSKKMQCYLYYFLDMKLMQSITLNKSTCSEFVKKSSIDLVHLKCVACG